MRRLLGLAFGLFVIGLLCLLPGTSRPQMIETIVNDTHHSGGASFTTLDPVNKLQTFTLSNGNLTAVSGACPGSPKICAARGTNPTTYTNSGKIYLEVTDTTGTGGSGAFDVMGVQNASYDPTTASNIPGYDSGANAIVIDLQSLTIKKGGTTQGAGGELSINCTNSGTIVALAFDFGANKMWVNCFAIGAWQGWNAAETSPNPDSGTGAVTLPGFATNYFSLGTQTASQSLTVNFGATSFQGAPNVTTFSAWH